MVWLKVWRTCLKLCPYLITALQHYVWISHNTTSRRKVPELVGAGQGWESRGDNDLLFGELLDCIIPFSESAKKSLFCHTKSSNKTRWNDVWVLSSHFRALFLLVADELASIWKDAKRFCPIPSGWQCCFPSGEISNRDQDLMFKRMRILFNCSSSVHGIYLEFLSILMLLLERPNNFPMSFIRIHVSALFSVTKCRQSYC